MTPAPPKVGCGVVGAATPCGAIAEGEGPIGIVAGGGRLPLLLAESLAARGRGVHIVGLGDEADAGIARYRHTRVRWGEVGRMLQALRRAGCREVVIAGTVRRPDLWQLRPDAGLLAALPRVLGLLAGGDDHVLTRVVAFFENAGFRVLGADQVAPELLSPAGRIGGPDLDGQARRDAALGFAVRRALRRIDTGQAVVVAGGRVLAIEGVEGTDAMLLRLAAGRGSELRSGVLAKGPKPGQELRVDMPAIGPRTIANARAAGLAAVVVEAGAVLLLDAAHTLHVAAAERCAVHGLPVDAAPAAPAAAGGPRALQLIGMNRPTRRDRRDLEYGLAAVEALNAVGEHGAALVARAHVLAIEPGDWGPATLARVSALRQWGLGGSGRSGVLVGQPPACDRETVADVLGRAAAQRLAGLALLGPAQLTEPFARAVRLADSLKLFLLVCAERTQGP